MKKKYLALFALLFFLWSCNKSENEECVVQPDISSIRLDLEIEQFQDTLVNLKSKQHLVDLFTRNPVMRDHIFRRREYPDDSVFINQIYQRFTNPSIDTLLAETKQVFGDLSEFKNQFQEAFSNIQHYYPGFEPPKVQTIISGIDTDLFVSDTLIIVSLDFFLGPGARYRPRVYDYLLRQYEKENIVPSCIMVYGISDRFNKTDMQDKTVLAEMIAYGKSYYFAKHMLPCVPDSIFTWYTPEEIKGARENQDLIWARLIQDQVLFSTSHVLKQKYLGERPKTLEVGEKCPGRIGQWIGWQIVNKYMETHPETTLPQMMNISNAQQLFKESRYRPADR